MPNAAEKEDHRPSVGGNLGQPALCSCRAAWSQRLTGADRAPRSPSRPRFSIGPSSTLSA
eukprot:8084907-Alexandrium_andersonii.AAC.1